jgi:hypothetical protein
MVLVERVRRREASIWENQSMAEVLVAKYLRLQRKVYCLNLSMWRLAETLLAVVVGSLLRATFGSYSPTLK